MQLFYFSDVNASTTSFVLDKEESRHIVKVLRKKEGDQVHVTDGMGNLYLCNLANANHNKCLLEVVEVTTHSKSRNYNLDIGVAPTKSNDRTEWFLEKATEIGIDKVNFLECVNSERKVIKTERFEKVVLSAMKQSLQYHLPEITELQSFEEFVSTAKHKQKFIAHCYDSPKKNLWEAIDSSLDEVLILIGPEGDFSEEEVDLAINHGFIPVSLSQNRLRTETAALVAVHTINLNFQ